MVVTIITPFSLKKPEKKRKTSTHDYIIEPIRWDGVNGAYIEVQHASYPDIFSEENMCDKCNDEYSDYFVSASSPGAYNFDMNTRLCNTCIMKVWFEILFNMRTPE